jgi:signal transduction histidine kinase/ligand-binding sensor domain-containing protein/DNA-binding response OmpR family regulator
MLKTTTLFSKSIFAFCLFSFLQITGQTPQLRFDHLTVENGLSQNSIHSITRDKYGFMWFGTWEGANRFDGYTFKIFRADEENPNALPNNRINVILSDSLGNLWVYTADWSHIFKYNFETETFTKLPMSQAPRYLARQLKRSRGNSSKKIRYNNIRWQITDAGLLQTNLVNDEQYLYQNDPANSQSLSDHVINTIYYDSFGTMWIGTQSGGINKTNLLAKPFTYYHSSALPGSGLCDNVVRAICRDNEGNLWVGSDHDGITIIQNDNTCRYFRKNTIIDDNIRSLYCDRFGFIWIGTKGGLDRYNPRTRQFKHYQNGQAGSIPHSWVFWIMEDHSGYLWIGTFNGIAKYDRKHDRFLAYDPNKTLNNKSVRFIVEDRKYQLWVGTEGGGISRIRRDSSLGFEEKLTAQHFVHQPGNANSLINNQTLTMVEDSAGMLWIGTNSGLCRMNPDSNTFRHFSVKNGFPDDLIMGLLYDKHQHIWVSHKRGLSRMNIRTFEIRNFDKHDGLQGNEFSQNAFFRDKRSGEMFFGGTNGLNSFFPDSIRENSFAPQAAITSLEILNQEVSVGQKINNHVVLPQSLLFTKKITLTWWDKGFALGFTALHYANPQGNRFKYKLEGFDKEWIFTDANRRVATYSNLSAGHYIFRVYAANSDGVWSATPATLAIHVLPPWWWSIWAWIVYSVAFLTLVWFVYKYIAARIEFRRQIWLEKVKSEKNEELNQLKFQFFTNISHEFRTPLTLIIDPLEKLLASKEQTPAQTRNLYILMQRNAKRLLGLINQLLDFRRIEAGQQTVNITSHDIVILIKNVAGAFEFQASQHYISLTVETKPDSLVTGVDADMLDKILFNLLSNAFKYTPDNGRISVELSLCPTVEATAVISPYSTIQIKVRDNGAGIPEKDLPNIFDVFYQAHKHKQVEGTGIGLALTRELVTLLNGSIYVESHEGEGTCFTVKLPYIEVSEKGPTDDVTVQKSDNFADMGTSETVTADTSQPLVLVVEDNDDVRLYLKSILETSYQVHLARNGKEGVEKAIEIIPDLIISDIMMPEMDGIELCKQLKTNECTSHVPVVLLTAKQSDQSRTEGYETGADAYLTKPFSSGVLLACITNLIESRQRLREIFSKGTSFELKKVAINLTDEAFFARITGIITENIEDPEFDTDALAQKLKMSRSQLYRKMKGLTNQSVADFIVVVRMNTAQELLLSGENTIAEVAYKVGYSLPTNFTRTFVKHFGQTPTAYLDSVRKKIQ